MKITLKYLGSRHSTVIKDVSNHDIIVYKDVFIEVSLNELQIKEILSKNELFEVKPFRFVETTARPVSEGTYKKILEWDGTTFREI